MDAVPEFVPSARFCLSAFPASRRGEEFRARLSGSWDAELIEDDAPFEMTSTYATLGEMTVTVSDYPARRVSRPRAYARADQLDHFYVQVPYAEGGMHVAADGRSVPLGAGQPVLMDLGQPFDTLQGRGRSIQAFMPRAAVEKLLPSASDLHAVPLQGAAASLLVDHLESLVAQLSEIPAAEAGAIAISTMHLIAASLATNRASVAVARPAIESALLRQALRLVDERLRDHELSAAHLAAALRVSRATLYRLFEPHGGVSQCIKTRRLDRVHELLAASRPRPTLANVAEDYGFASGAHLSRAFREHFGCCPSEVEPVTREPNPGMREPRAAVAGGLADWLRRHTH